MIVLNKEILQPIADYLKKELQEELIQQEHKATGELINSIDVVVNEILGGFEISGSSIFYGQYVERGRMKGARGVPIDALINWIKVRGIKIGSASEKSMAFMFQASIKKKGIKPSLFVEKTLKKYKNKIGSDIEQYMYSHVLGIIEKIFVQSLKLV